MDRRKLAALIQEYDRAGPPLHELLKVDRAELRRWLDGARIPRAQAQRLDWWESAMRVRKALEASGLPECAEMAALDRTASSAILRKAPRKEQDRAAQAALDHAASCELCRQLEAVRVSAGPMKGEPFPGYREFTQSQEERARSLWVVAPLLGVSIGAMYALRDAEYNPRAFWMLGWFGITMPVFFWAGLRRSASNQAAAVLCLVCGIAGLALTDLGAVAAEPWSYLPILAVFVATAVLGLLAGRKQ